MGRENATIDELTNWNHLHLEKTFQDKTTKVSEVTRKFNEVLVPTAQNLTTLNVIIAVTIQTMLQYIFITAAPAQLTIKLSPLPHIFGSYDEATFWIVYKNAICPQDNNGNLHSE